RVCGAGALRSDAGRAYTPPGFPLPEETKLTFKELKDKLIARCGPSKNDLELPASIGSRQAAVEVQHIRLWRDTNYLASLGDGGRPAPPDSDDPGWLKKLDMKTPDDKEAHIQLLTMYVQPKHYLVLGDNSPASSDSRTWGLVPHRLMLGRALVVYFPFDRAGAIR